MSNITCKRIGRAAPFRRAGGLLACAAASRGRERKMTKAPGAGMSAGMTLASELDIKAAAPLAAGLIAARGADLVLDASQVERVGAQCLQVLLSAAATWGADGQELAIEAPSAAFAEAVRIAGLDLSHVATSRSGAASDFTARNC
jgi:chemotaxis protein CheX